MACIPLTLIMCSERGKQGENDDQNSELAFVSFASPSHANLEEPASSISLQREFNFCRV